MTPAQFSAALTALGWSQRHLATLLECDTNLPVRWAHGRAGVPAPIARWLDAMVRCQKRLPPPQNWRVK